MNKKMNTTAKWTIKDVITTVLLSALLVVMQFIVNMVCMANHFVSMTLSVGFSVFICAPVYFLMVQRVGKRGVSFIYMTLLGIIFLIMGNWYLLPYYIIIGLICEAVLWKHGAYQNPRRLMAAWTVSSLLFNGTNLLPIWFFWDAYYAFAVSSGMSQGYIDSYVRYFTVPYWIIFIVAFTTVCGFAGSLIASRLIKKHFEKAGVL